MTRTARWCVWCVIAAGAAVFAGCESGEDGHGIRQTTWLASSNSVLQSLEFKNHDIAVLWRGGAETRGTYDQDGDHVTAEFSTAAGPVAFDLTVSGDQMTGTMVEGQRFRTVSFGRLVVDVDDVPISLGSGGGDPFAPYGDD